ncbi:CDF family Co(II)/Ni(II) efflux transporter DmeF [Pararhizobium capsulatum]|nr:CDF family Co(II)/Ni(II) efflux transporter DmeF [Pararhizobium capsulatum]
MRPETSSLVHDHVFLGDDHQRNERRVWMVIALTASMMVAEITAGSYYGSMALVADGWHMATHASAMLIAALAYLFARRRAYDRRFTFGTGKLGDLAGFASAVLLALIALLIGWESVVRLANPVEIGFSQAIVVAVIGLVVNLVSALLLKGDHGHHHGHGHGHPHEHPQPHAHHDHHGGHHHHHADHHNAHSHAATDNNLRAVYLHVIADALTSVLAIVALVAGSIYGWQWLDPAMGVVGAVVIAHWSWGLIRQSGAVLVDAAEQGNALSGEIRRLVPGSGDEITDLHVWQVGPGHFAAIVALASQKPLTPADYKARLAPLETLSHVTVEVTPLAA